MGRLQWLRRYNAATSMQKLVRGWLARRRLRKAVTDAMWEEKVMLIHAQTEGTATQLATLKFLRDNLVEKVWYMVTTWVFLILMILETVPQLGGRKAQELIK